MKTPTSHEGATVSPVSQPSDRLAAAGEKLVRGTAWAAQAAAAVIYLFAAAQPSTWRPIFEADPFGAVCMSLIAICMLGLWAASLREEQARFYDRIAQRSSRRAGLFGHLSVLFIAVVGVSGSPGRIGWWIVLAMLCLAAVVSWAMWMQIRFLPDEDQAVIDAILSREAAQRAATFDASEREKRRERLTAIVGSLGYSLADTPAPRGKQADAPAIKWPIPSGKHKPLVYFIRNGNRLKIGTTVELKRRIRTLALRAENVALLVDGDQRREREFHKQFAEHRIGNTEWFAYESPLTDYVADQNRLARKEEAK